VSDLLNFLYFAVGLGVGLFGVWLNQKNFLAQQQDKFNRISDELEHLRESLVALTQLSTDQSFAREERLMKAALREDAAEVGAEQITAIVRREMDHVDANNKAAATHNQQITEAFRDVLRRLLETQDSVAPQVQNWFESAERAIAQQSAGQLALAAAQTVSRRDAAFLATLHAGDIFPASRLSSERKLSEEEAETKLTRWAGWGWLERVGNDAEGSRWKMIVAPHRIQAIVRALKELPPPRT
jgi:hypothetical protein